MRLTGRPQDIVMKTTTVWYVSSMADRSGRACTSSSKYDQTTINREGPLVSWVPHGAIEMCCGKEQGSRHEARKRERQRYKTRS